VDSVFFGRKGKFDRAKKMESTQESGIHRRTKQLPSARFPKKNDKILKLYIKTKNTKANNEY